MPRVDGSLNSVTSVLRHQALPVLVNSYGSRTTTSSRVRHETPVNSTRTSLRSSDCDFRVADIGRDAAVSDGGILRVEVGAPRALGRVDGSCGSALGRTTVVDVVGDRLRGAVR